MTTYPYKFLEASLLGPLRKKVKERKEEFRFQHGFMAGESVFTAQKILRRELA
jgi:hypothetical protein